ncbi:MAG: M10 family metallopeptidase domain-containing protein [Actinomycetota bacterium]|nr:M10 family metallopeptidase domain-containing protein [Actinomycetota bacterium]
MIGARRSAAALLLVAAALGSCGRSSNDSVVDDEITTPRPDSPDCPVRGHLAADYNGKTRAGVEAPVDYAFLDARRGGCLPVRFNPCEPVHYVVNAALAPPGALDDLAEAIRRVEAATGLTFVNDGPTDEPAAVNRRLSQPERYPGRWPPLLIVWEHGGAFRMEPTNPAGGQSYPVDDVSVSGVLIVNVDATALDHGRTRPADGFGEGTTWGRVFIHELGHIVGLGHVARSDQVMFPELGVQSGYAEFHAGDLAGLRLLGREAGCLETPPRPGPR